jgi:hypothetical protein
MFSVFAHQDVVTLERQLLPGVRDVAHPVAGMNLKHHGSFVY